MPQQPPRPDPDEPLFIGWGDTPLRDRRAFFRQGLALVASGGALGWGAGALQSPPGTGQWDANVVRDWHGLVTASPYAMLRTRDLGDRPMTVLLSCLGKCGVSERIGTLSGQVVKVRGSLIQRGPHAMLAVDEEGTWIQPDPHAKAADDPALSFGTAEPLGRVSLRGEILDSKCWFGAMRPSSGQIHKGCASLCIRGGIPPAFFGQGVHGESQLMIMTREGRAHGPDLLPWVADAVRIEATVFRRDDLLFLDAPVGAFRRL